MFRFDLTQISNDKGQVCFWGMEVVINKWNKMFMLLTSLGILTKQCLLFCVESFLGNQKGCFL